MAEAPLCVGSDPQVGNVSYVSDQLRLGALTGNHFRILMRNVVSEDLAQVRTGLSLFFTCGPIVYFELQRCGSRSNNPDHCIHRPLAHTCHRCAQASGFVSEGQTPARMCFSHKLVTLCASDSGLYSCEDDCIKLPLMSGLPGLRDILAGRRSPWTCGLPQPRPQTIQRWIIQRGWLGTRLESATSNLNTCQRPDMHNTLIHTPASVSVLCALPPLSVLVVSVLCVYRAFSRTVQDPGLTQVSPFVWPPP